ncbi:hypothetical protein AB0F17_42815 [Nonomuraea sp. NPDC026600]|uniref:hypothetical protein n=1 Tax=Nonomuraea sp. NPDC026600 TaxID=3155363 RepID=UPI00340F2707
MADVPAKVWFASITWSDGRRFQYCTDTPGLAYKRAAETLRDLITDATAVYIPHRYTDFLEDNPYDPATATDEQAQEWVDLFDEQLMPDEQLEAEVQEFDVQRTA